MSVASGLEGSADVTTSTKPADMSYRDRLRRVYEVYAPDKIPNIESALFAYSGREEEMMAKAAAKYGPEPTDLFYELFLASNGGGVQTAGKADTIKGEGVGDGGDASAPPPVAEKRSPHSERLMWLFLTYCPEKLLLFDDVLYAYRSDPRQMIEDFVAEFGPEPQIDYRKQRLKRFYEYYCPEKVNSVDQILLAYASDPEEKLFDDLKRKYGPEPSPYCATTSALDKEQHSKVQRGRHASMINTAKAIKAAGGHPSLDALEDPAAAHVPITLSRDASEEFTKLRLVEFYKYYCPQKLPFVDTILETYKMHPRGVRQLFFLLEEKYGPEPCQLTSSSPFGGDANNSSDTVSRVSGSDRFSALSDVTTTMSPRHVNHHNLPIFGESAGGASANILDSIVPHHPLPSVRPEDLGQLSERLFRMVLFYDASRLPDFYSVVPFLTAADAAQQLQLWIQYHGPEPSETALMDVQRLISSKEAAEAVVHRVHSNINPTGVATGNPPSSTRFPPSSGGSSFASPALHTQVSFQREAGDSSSSLPSLSYGSRQLRLGATPGGSRSPENGVTRISSSPAAAAYDVSGAVAPATLAERENDGDSRPASTLTHRQQMLRVTVVQPDGHQATTTVSSTSASVEDAGIKGEGFAVSSLGAGEAPHGAAQPQRQPALQQAAVPLVRAVRRQLSIATSSPFPYALYLAAQRAGIVKMFLSWWRYNHLAVDDDDEDEGGTVATSLEDLMAALLQKHHSEAANNAIDISNDSITASAASDLLADRGFAVPASSFVAASAEGGQADLAPWRRRAESVLVSIPVMVVSGLPTSTIVPVELRSQCLADVVEYVRPFWIDQSDAIRQAFLQTLPSLVRLDRPDSNSEDEEVMERHIMDAMIALCNDTRVLSVLNTCVTGHLRLPGHSTSTTHSTSASAIVANLGVVISQQLATHALKYLVLADLVEDSERRLRFLGGTGLMGSVDTEAKRITSIVEDEERSWRAMRRWFVDGVHDIVRLDHMYRMMHAEAMIRDGIETEEDFQLNGIQLSWSRCMYLSTVVPEGSPWRWNTKDAAAKAHTTPQQPQQVAAAVWGKRDELTTFIDAQWTVFTKPIFHPTAASASELKLRMQMRTPRPAGQDNSTSPSSAPPRRDSRVSHLKAAPASPALSAKVRQRVLSQSKVVTTPEGPAALYDAVASLRADPRVERFRARRSAAETSLHASPPRPRYESPTRHVHVHASADQQEVLTSPRDPYAPLRFASTLRSPVAAPAASSMVPSTLAGANTPRRSQQQRGATIQTKSPAASRAVTVGVRSQPISDGNSLGSRAAVQRGHFSRFSDFSVPPTSQT